jgi:hypothetical protein
MEVANKLNMYEYLGVAARLLLVAAIGSLFSHNELWIGKG